MTSADILKELEALGKESYRKVLFNHGIREPVFGVKIEYLQKIRKRIRKNHELALELYETRNYDAQYLAGLIADESRMTRSDLKRWLKTANCTPLCGTVVAWVAAESPHGRALALDWIESKQEATAHTGWVTLSGLVAITEDADLDLDEVKRLLERVERRIHQEPNAVRSAMNGFVIATGIYVKALTSLAVQTGTNIGPVSVDMGNTACKVPYAPDYIAKAKKRGSIGRKRVTVRC